MGVTIGQGQRSCQTRRVPTVPMTDLPIEAVIDDLRAALGERGAAVLSAEPGAGKTTVVPLRLLDEPWLAGGSIVLLEPRRIAARAAARRMARLSHTKVGGLVGFRTRDEQRVSDTTRIEVITEGILTRRVQRDPELGGVGLVIFDELHERSLHSDLALALTLEAREALRPDLRLLAMSATIDTARVAALVGGQPSPVPVVRAPGRQHEVRVEWDPPRGGEAVEHAAVRAVRRVLDTEDGDVLVFLPGAREINRVCRELRGLVPSGVDVLPLYGALASDAQDRALALASAGRRKVVVSTDIAETSLTVEGVRVVVDAGRARVSVHDPARGMARLETATASQASADQRAGRAGRTDSGVAVRLWSPATHYQRDRFDTPEILGADLAGFALEAAIWGAAPDALPLLDPPPPAALRAAADQLLALRLLDERGQPSELGRRAAELPLHPRLAAMVAMAVEHGFGWLACVVAAALEERDILGGPLSERPVDLTLRVGLIADRHADHHGLDRGRREHARRRARSIADRLHIRPEQLTPADLDLVGSLVVRAYPDRVGRRRSERGRFLLASGAGATMASTDGLASEEFIVAVDVDGRRAETRVRLGVGIDRVDLDTALEDQVVARRELVWDDDRGGIYAIDERALGSVILSRSHQKVEPDAGTAALVLGHVRAAGVDVLGWTRSSARVRDRVQFVRAAGDDSWPDLSDAGLLDVLEVWLGPFVGDVVRQRELERIDLTNALWTYLGWHRRAELDRLLPDAVELPSGRRAPVDYTRERPTVAARVQEFYGCSRGPTIIEGRLPLTLELLSPADRPVQLTSDLEGFWQGSWRDVRKDMAGRYPKHRWPEDPLAEEPGRR